MPTLTPFGVSMAPPSTAPQNAYVERLRALRHRAEVGPVGKQRRSMELYKMLADCAAAATHAMAVPEVKSLLIEELLHENRITRDANSRSRKGQVNYNTASCFQLVCRYVFKHGSSDSANRSNWSRYGKALEQAYEKGIVAGDLAGWLKTNGGVNALFKVRPTGRRDVRSKTLWLSEPTTLPKEGEVTLVLRRNPNGSFTVVSNSYDLSHHENQPRPAEGRDPQ